MSLDPCDGKDWNHGLPGTETKHGDQSLLLTFGDREAPDDPDRHEQDDHVLKDV